MSKNCPLFKENKMSETGIDCDCVEDIKEYKKIIAVLENRLAAAMRLLKRGATTDQNRPKVDWIYSGKKDIYGYYLNDVYAGETWDDVVFVESLLEVERKEENKNA